MPPLSLCWRIIFMVAENVCEVKQKKPINNIYSLIHINAITHTHTNMVAILI